MKNRTYLKQLRNIAAWGSIIVFFIMAFEVMIMTSKAMMKKTIMLPHAAIFLSCLR